VDTPAYVFVRDAFDVERAADELTFPLFVKHPSSYASNGLTNASRVTDVAQLREQVGRTVDAFGWALVEEFIEGTECTSLVVEGPDPTKPHVYRALQYDFPDGESFKHYDLKWVNYDGLKSFSVRDATLDAAIRKASEAFFLGIRGSGFGRCDVRVDRDGRVFMLEINPNCGVYYPESDPGSADLILLSDAEGHRGFTDRLIEAAYARKSRHARGWHVAPRSAGGFGVFAAKDLGPGSEIFSVDSSWVRIMDSAAVPRLADDRHERWLTDQSWPLSDELWVVWSEDPSVWRPIRHSCDPSAWWSGLTVEARRPIRSGEEITLDYGTFHDERMPDFACSCGAENCRSVIRGDDHLSDVMERYGAHLSEHVRRRRARRRSMS
jgi:D-alanine-D-alanine ligase